MPESEPRLLQGCSIADPVQEERETEMFKQFARLREEEGATAIEYGLIAGLIAVVIIGIITTVGGDLSTMFGEISSGLGGTGAPTE